MSTQSRTFKNRTRYASQNIHRHIYYRGSCKVCGKRKRITPRALEPAYTNSFNY